ncbi:MAG: molybdopterin-guanine dinucleotide biosynthesis protein MobB, partial [Acidiferrobacterales bacterium]|nr:molybdopterin-guanine dinucleotide biosynthesis protein MobB [Acidiferrobacterales bacterium]
RSVLIVEKENPAEPGLQDMLPLLDTSALDLILVEGFKTESFPKIELHRVIMDRPLLCQQDHNIIAVASDAPLPSVTHIPILDLNRPEKIVEFILAYTAAPQQRASSGP